MARAGTGPPAANPERASCPTRAGLALRVALLSLALAALAFGCASTGASSGPSVAPERNESAGAAPAAARPAGPGTSTNEPGAAHQPSAARFDTAEAPLRGPAAGEVLVEVYSDFECPYCSLARRHTERLLADFPSVRVAYRHFPLAAHRHAETAAEASVEAYAQGGDDAFWCYHDQVFDHQSSLSRELLVRLARRCHLDAQAMEAALRDHRHQGRVTADRQRGDALGVHGTPSFTVNGALVDGADYTSLEEAVDRVHPSW